MKKHLFPLLGLILFSFPLFSQTEVICHDALSLLIYDSLDGLIRTALETEGDFPEENEEFDFRKQYVEESWIIDVNIPGLYPFWAAIPLPTMWEFVLGYRYLFLPDRPTSICGSFSGGYTTQLSYRGINGDPIGYLSEEELLESPLYPSRYLSDEIIEDNNYLKSGILSFNEIDALWSFGITQEILPRRDGSDPSLKATVKYRSKFEMFTEGFSWSVESVDQQVRDYHNRFKDESGVADPDGAMTNTIFANVQFSTMDLHPSHHFWEGVTAEAAIEWNPSSGNPFYMEMFGYQVLMNPDFLRISANTTGGYNFIDLKPDKKNNTFNIGIYGGIFVDWIYGSLIPQTELQNYGGITPHPRRIRGYEALAFDTALKVETNIELRMNLPSIYFTNLVPGLFGFVDAGYFHGWKYSQNYSNSGTWVVSAGGGIHFFLVFSYLAVSFEAPLYLSMQEADGYKIKVEGGFHL